MVVALLKMVGETTQRTCLQKHAFDSVGRGPFMVHAINCVVSMMVIILTCNALGDKRIRIHMLIQTKGCALFAVQLWYRAFVVGVVIVKQWLRPVQNR